jgi:hypothetical protein
MNSSFLLEMKNPIKLYELIVNANVVLLLMTALGYICMAAIIMYSSIFEIKSLCCLPPPEVASSSGTFMSTTQSSVLGKFFISKTLYICFIFLKVLEHVICCLETLYQQAYYLPESHGFGH